jgi:hypothetical protein
MNHLESIPAELIARIFDVIPAWMHLVLYHVNTFRNFCQNLVINKVARPKLLEYIADKPECIKLQKWFFPTYNFQKLQLSTNDYYFSIAAGCKKLIFDILPETNEPKKYY